VDLVCMAMLRHVVGTSRPAWQSSRTWRGFATTAFTVPAQNSTPEQTLFVAGLNEGKFFGQDGAEEALKMVERIADHSPKYTLLFGIPERRYENLEQDHRTKDGRLTPSRQLEGIRHCEMIPIMQAGMVDKCPRKPIGRSVYTDQVHVAWMLWTHPREALKVYWAFWRRKNYKDRESCKFWMTHFPASAPMFFEERAHIIAIRAIEHIMELRKQDLSHATVLVVNNDIYDLVVSQLTEYMGKDAAEKFNSQDFLRQLRDNADHLCQDVIDLTPLLVFVYGILPLCVAQFLFLGGKYYLKKSGLLDDYMASNVDQRL